MKITPPLGNRMKANRTRFHLHAPDQLSILSYYEDLVEVGRGTMGVVYRARQVSLNRIVALKVMQNDLFFKPREMDRFLSEAEKVAQLQHPHIVHIYDRGLHEADDRNALPFFCMEYAEGGSLDRRLQNRACLAVAQAAELVRQVAEGVHHAHLRGIIHRDLKPGNVLLTREGHPKITDFSIAKRLNGKSDRTAQWAILGTPTYMAPEQAWGRSRQVTPAADTYALGAILFRVVAGRPPFLGAGVLEQVRTRRPLAPSHYQPTVPAAIDELCLKCLEKNPRHRPDSALAVAQALAEFCARRGCSA